MTWTRDHQITARDVLAMLYASSSEARRVLFDAGFEKLERFDFVGPPLTVWTTVVEKLALHHELDAVIAVARREYPGNRALQSLVATLTSPPPQPPPPHPRAPTQSLWRVVTQPLVDFRKLTGPQWSDFQSCLENAFPSYSELAHFTQFTFGENLNAIANGQNLARATYDLIQWTQARGHTEHLYRAARAARPDHAALTQFGVAVVAPTAPSTPTAVAASELESILHGSAPTVPVAALMKLLGEVAVRVCRIEIAARPVGTGFLVGPSTVMTCYHVMRDVIAGTANAAHVVIRFDWHPGAEGKVVRLANHWLIDAAPPNVEELARTPGDTTLAHESLDYAVLRLSEPVGERTVAGSAPTTDRPARGWLTLPEDDIAFSTNEALCIAQHPDGRAMEFAIGFAAGATLNAEGTRVAHTINTEPGSSGSPVLRLTGALVALHHAGASFVAAHNRAVPIDAICAQLRRRGVFALIAPEA